MSEWTVDTLREAIMRELEGHKKDVDRRFVDQDRARDTAFIAAQTAIKQSADNAKEAVTKSEIGVEKRSDAVYVTITKLQDALAAVMPRSEAEQRFSAVSEKIEGLKSTSDTGAGKSVGISATVAYIITAVGLAFGAVGVVLAFSK